MKCNKFKITIKTHESKDIKWVQELIDDAVRQANDGSYRGWGWKTPILGVKVKQKKRKAK